MRYGFSMHNGDGSSREKHGAVTLRNDGAARAFGKRVIREMTSGNPEQYAGWTMDVASGERAVCSLPFPAAASGRRAAGSSKFNRAVRSGI
jgi:hypothetical protein